MCGVAGVGGLWVAGRRPRRGAGAAPLRTGPARPRAQLNDSDDMRADLSRRCMFSCLATQTGARSLARPHLPGCAPSPLAGLLLPPRGPAREADGDEWRGCGRVMT